MHEFSERLVHAKEADMARSAHYHIPPDLDAWAPERRATIERSGYYPCSRCHRTPGGRRPAGSQGTGYSLVLEGNDGTVLGPSPITW